MKKLLPIIILMLLFLAGCSFKPAEMPDFSNSLGLDIDGLTQLSFNGSDPSSWNEIDDTDPDESNVQGILYFYFNDYLNGSSVNTNNIVITTTSTNGDISDVVITYEKAFKRIKIEGTFEDDAAYTVKFVAGGVKSASGSYFDGNGNGINDGTPFDDIYFQFYTGTGAVDFEDYSNPYVTSVDPMGGWINPIGTTVFVTFSGEVDSESFIDNFELRKASNDDQIDLELIAWGGTWAFFQLDGGGDLAYRTPYYLNFATSEMMGTNDMPMINPNGYYVANIPDIKANFLTFGETVDDDDTPPYVVSTPSVGSGAELATVNFSEEMDPATLTSANIKVFAYDNYVGNWIYVPGDLSIMPGNKSVEYSLINVQWNRTGDLKIYVAKEVKDASDKAWMLDTNGNGIGGESGEPVWGEPADDYMDYIY